MANRAKKNRRLKNLGGPINRPINTGHDRSHPLLSDMRQRAQMDAQDMFAKLFGLLDEGIVNDVRQAALDQADRWLEARGGWNVVYQHIRMTPPASKHAVYMFWSADHKHYFFIERMDQVRMSISMGYMSRVSAMNAFKN